ncbi:response regulator containing a CheY-like receiver domain and an HTH DNA-binding domain [Aequorivita sublithincola DSM 14238]|uniref:Response regulator containing a CheY-like receiver domain and an HTH DNA-binding domain n=1 Tax=Aequorivita sublithincola (strain DSM 14238 / LMG 21431 / ACAM 643 / 9-3) TaxID=746697 RepID=I3YWA4_AEQSU|nr:response regulator transcription factor [Aequorivita sublithincola]AFL81272.1 response regulator containing a CheY-like receiver domain and an HTH DNA-binding domain [Aequorivita sublithincola DSM 14238]
MSNPIKLFIVDDHQMLIEGIKSLLQDETTIKIVGTATTAELCKQFFIAQSADVVFMDINLPDMSGIDLTKFLIEKYPNLNIIALSTFTQGTYVRKMIENGAKGYLLKNASKFEILKAIETVKSGQKYLTPEAEEALKYEINLQKKLPKITKREKEVLILIVEGLTNNQIAEKLFISIDTVDSHRKNLYSKLNVNNTAMLIGFVNENKFLDS